MGTKKFLIDAEKCTSCQLCVIACKDEHVGADYLPWTKAQPSTGQFWVDVHGMERGRIPRVKVSYLPLLCQHCTNAACVTACPENAIKRRDDGLVWIDQEACTGCGLCQEACPYDVIYMNADLGVAQKCTGCAHRVDAGMLPRCAEVCPHDVILFGEAGDEVLDLYVRQRRTACVEFVQALSIRNKRVLEEKDPAVRKQRFDELIHTAQTPALAREYLLNSSMIAGVRRAAAVT